MKVVKEQWQTSVTVCQMVHDYVTELRKTLSDVRTFSLQNLVNSQDKMKEHSEKKVKVMSLAKRTKYCHSSLLPSTLCLHNFRVHITLKSSSKQNYLTDTPDGRKPQHLIYVNRLKAQYRKNSEKKGNSEVVMCTGLKKIR